VCFVQRVGLAAARVPERRAAAELDGLLPVGQHAPAFLQPRAASRVSRAVVPERRLEVLLERQAASAERLPASSRALPSGQA
jgi:hypothetical protein